LGVSRSKFVGSEKVLRIRLPKGREENQEMLCYESAISLPV